MVGSHNKILTRAKSAAKALLISREAEIPRLALDSLYSAGYSPTLVYILSRTHSPPNRKYQCEVSVFSWEFRLETCIARITYNKMAARRKFLCGPHEKSSQTASGLQPTNWIHDLICFVVSFQLQHTTRIISKSLRKVLTILCSDFHSPLQSPGQKDKQNFKEASASATLNLRLHTRLPT